MKKAIYFLIFLLMIGMVSAAILDYDTFDTGGTLDVTEYFENPYDSMPGYDGINNVSISNGILVFNQTAGVDGLWIYVNYTNIALDEYTLYFKVKSSLNTEYIEFLSYRTYINDAQSDSIMTVEGDSVYHFSGQTTAISSDEWIEFWYYYNNLTSYHNITVFSSGILIYNYSNTFNSGNHSTWNFYWDYSGGSEAVLLMDEWALCSGYDLDCIPPTNCNDRISVPGYYTLENDLLCNNTVGIYIQSDDVTLDCGWNVIEIDNITGYDDAAIYVNDSDNVLIKNCNILNANPMMYVDGQSGFGGIDSTNVTFKDNNMTFLKSACADCDWVPFFYIDTHIGQIKINNNTMYANSTDGGDYIQIFECLANDTQITNNDVSGTFHTGFVNNQVVEAHWLIQQNSFNTSVTPNDGFGTFIDNVFPGYFEITNNTIVGFLPIFDKTIAAIYNISGINTVGNYYGNCTDTTPYDGICDDPYNETEFWDQFPLSFPYDVTLPCFSSWSCTEYDCHEDIGFKNCSSVFDNNECGVAYGGTYTEFDTTCPVMPSTIFGVASSNLDIIDDYTNVSNFKITSTSGTTYIQWQNNVNINGTNFSTTVKVDTGFVSVNAASLNETLDSVATVAIDLTGIADATCGNFELYYASNYYTNATAIIANGNKVATEGDLISDCDDSSICQNVACSLNVVTFQAQHFDSFAMRANTEARAGCRSTQLIVYAGLALLAVILIAIAAFAITQVVSNEVGAAALMAILVLSIGLAVVVMIGYVIISAAGTALC